MDAELAAAIAERAHWAVHGTGAVYAPPGAAAVVAVSALREPTSSQRYQAVVLRRGVAVRALVTGHAAGAVRWAETVPL